MTAPPGTNAGSRHGMPAMPVVHAAEICMAGHAFHRSGNGTRLNGAVPADFNDFGRP